MSTGFYFGMGGVPSVYDEYPDEQPILIGGDPLDLDTLTAGGELVTIVDCLPISGLAPAPSPLVNFSPSCILTSAKDLLKS